MVTRLDKNHPETVTMVPYISELRVACAAGIDRIREKLEQPTKPKCIAELTLAMRKLQEARHWLGESLSHYDTGFVPSDVPGNPESASKPAA